jgi:hypothetical protein
VREKLWLRERREKQSDKSPPVGRLTKVCLHFFDHFHKSMPSAVKISVLENESTFAKRLNSVVNNRPVEQSQR